MNQTAKLLLRMGVPYKYVCEVCATRRGKTRWYKFWEMFMCLTCYRAYNKQAGR